METINQQKDDGVNQIEQSSRVMTLFDKGSRNIAYFQLEIR
jgi:hypothetical protein